MFSVCDPWEARFKCCPHVHGTSATFASSGAAARSVWGDQLYWSLEDGVDDDTTTGVNYNVSQPAHNPSLALGADGKLYLAWSERTWFGGFSGDWLHTTRDTYTGNKRATGLATLDAGASWRGRTVGTVSRELLRITVTR